MLDMRGCWITTGHAYDGFIFTNQRLDARPITGFLLKGLTGRETSSRGKGWAWESSIFFPHQIAFQHLYHPFLLYSTRGRWVPSPGRQRGNPSHLSGLTGVGNSPCPLYAEESRKDTGLVSWAARCSMDLRVGAASFSC